VSQILQREPTTRSELVILSEQLRYDYRGGRGRVTNPDFFAELFIENSCLGLKQVRISNQAACFS
jgi:hypothetical protein